MAAVTQIGLGAMGSALARAFLTRGHDVTVWNRTAARADPLVALGAAAGPTAADAVTASAITVVCVDDYDATWNLIEGQGLLAVLPGRTLVQLSTGTPEQARTLAERLEAHSVRVLDGAIMPYPDGIGADDAQILVAGPTDVVAACRPVLDCLGGDVRHVGEEVGAAAVLDLALLTHELSEYLGVWHGARICEAEGLGVDALAALYPPDSPAAQLAWRIEQRRYDDPRATLTVWAAALDRILEEADAVGINSEIPQFLARLFRRALALGHGDDDVAAVVEVLRRTP